MPISSQSTHYSHDIPSHICIKFVASAVLNTIKIVIKLAMEKKIELLCHCERRMRHRRFSFFLFCTILTNGTTKPITDFSRFSPDKKWHLYQGKERFTKYSLMQDRGHSQPDKNHDQVKFSMITIQ